MDLTQRGRGEQCGSHSAGGAGLVLRVLTPRPALGGGQSEPSLWPAGSVAQGSDTTERTRVCVAGAGGEACRLRSCRARGTGPWVGSLNLRVALPLAPGALLSRPVPPTPCLLPPHAPTDGSGPRATRLSRLGRTTGVRQAPETVKGALPLRGEVTRTAGTSVPRACTHLCSTPSFTHSCIVQRTLPSSCPASGARNRPESQALGQRVQAG